MRTKDLLFLVREVTRVVDDDVEYAHCGCTVYPDDTMLEDVRWGKRGYCDDAWYKDTLFILHSMFKTNAQVVEGFNHGYVPCDCGGRNCSSNSNIWHELKDIKWPERSEE